MADLLVLEWLDEFESLTESEIHTYSNEQEHNHEVMIALYNVLSEPQKCKSDHLVDGVCQQLLNFYRSGESHLRRFTVQFIPALVFLHLSDKSYSAVQTLLVSLYNLEVIDAKGQPRTLSFRVPSIAQSSIFHDSSSLEPAFIAENSLRRWEECNTKLVSWGPLPQVECINAQNRQRLATALIFIYNQQLSNVMPQGVEHTCRGISRLVTQGFNNNSDSIRSSIESDIGSSQHGLLRRIPVSSPLLVELLHIIYHAAERCTSVAMQALHDVVQRAGYESYAEVLLAANAIKNLLHHSPAVSAAPRPSHVPSVSKSMITNASFRTKKLPEPISRVFVRVVNFEEKWLLNPIQPIPTSINTYASFLDLTKAFDCISFEILYKKLFYYNFDMSSVSLIQSYLEEREQYVLFKNQPSGIRGIQHGVPQGSVLGPLLFLVYINDLPNTNNLMNLLIILFADDTTSLLRYHPSDPILQWTQSSQVRIENWFLANRLSLNNSKTQFINFTLQTSPPNLESDASVKFLGVHLDPGLSWETHITQLSSKLSRITFLIRNDIPIQDPAHQTAAPPIPASADPALDSITEEQEEGERAGRAKGGALKHLPKIPGIGKKHKAKGAGADQQIELTVGGGETGGEAMGGEGNHSVHVSVV
ncbi:unnamed protein product [Phaedon cochleariae]|uniref:Reverse transcriptase domain-containing protein n=1 Tax=Phaedon cochleariae TaxID=80249 RepID=A0A9P0DDS9_PHACE|nr:unnamed protein product [Phaedon cochleariae]